MLRSWAIALALAAGSAAAGEILDRIAVTVGTQVITESDVLRDLRVTAFLDRKATDLKEAAPSGADKRKAADRLVEQTLILSEAALTRTALATPAEAQKLVEAMKPEYGGEAEFQAALAAKGLTDAELAGHLLAGLRTLRFTDLRFRGEVQISDQDLHDYYDVILKDTTKSGGIGSFEESRAQMETLLINQRTMQALDRWLESARMRTRIVYREAAFQ